MKQVPGRLELEPGISGSKVRIKLSESRLEDSSRHLGIIQSNSDWLDYLADPGALCAFTFFFRQFHRYEIYSQYKDGIDPAKNRAYYNKSQSA